MIADRKNSLVSQYESFRRKPSQDLGNFLRHGSLERYRSGSSEKRNSWTVEESSVGLDTFRPVTLTVSSFFKQVKLVYSVVSELIH